MISKWNKKKHRYGELGMCSGIVMVASGKEDSWGIYMDHVEKCLQWLGKKPIKFHSKNQWSPWAAWQKNQGNMSSHGRPNGIPKEKKLHCKVEKAWDKWEASLRSYRNSLKSFLAFKNATLAYSYISKHSLWKCSIKRHSTPTLLEHSEGRLGRRSSLAQHWFVIRPRKPVPHQTTDSF